MLNLYYVNSNTFKTTGDYTNILSPGVRVRLWARATVVTEADGVDPHSAIFGDVLQDTGGADSLILGRDPQRSIDYIQSLNVVQYFIEFRILSSSFSDGGTSVVIAGVMDHGFIGWTINNNIPGVVDVDSSSVTTDEGGVATHYFSLRGASNELRAGIITFEQLLFTAPDPTKILIKIYSESGVLLDVGHPDEFGYYRPNFGETKWESTLFGGENCPCSAGLCNDPVIEGLPTYSTAQLAIASATPINLPQSHVVDFIPNEFFAIGMDSLNISEGYNFSLEEVNLSLYGDFNVYIYDPSGVIAYDMITTSLTGGGATEMTGIVCHCEPVLHDCYMVFENTYHTQFNWNVGVTSAIPCNCGGGE